jgi:hypothetical protein
MDINQRMMNSEEELKGLLFAKINEATKVLAEEITNLKDINEKMGIDVKLSNAGIAYSNKINELIRLFNESGISFFVNYEESMDEFVANTLGSAILDDLTNMIGDASKSLKTSTTYYNELVKKMSRETNVIKMIYVVYKKLFTKGNLDDKSLKQFVKKEDLDKLINYLNAYQEATERIYDYSLDNNMVDSISKYIINIVPNDEYLKILLDDEIIPMINKLGYSHLTNDLYKRLEELGYVINNKEEDVTNGLSK